MVRRVVLTAAWALFLAMATWLLTAPPGGSLEEVMADVRAEFPEIQRIDPAELAPMLAPGSTPPQLFDVRSPEEFEVSHLPGASRMPPNASLRMAGALLDRTRPAVLYCSIGYRSASLVDSLRRAGWTNVWQLEGSIFRWATEGRPIEPGAAVHPHSPAYATLLRPGLAHPVGWLETALIIAMDRGRMKGWIAACLLGVLLVWESVAPLTRWFAGSARARAAHGWRNLALGYGNAVMAALLTVPPLAWAARLADEGGFGLLHWLGLEGPARWVVALLALDLWNWSWHWLNHHWSFLWRCHRVHHSDLALDVTSAVRFHPGEIFLSGMFRLPVAVLAGLRLEEVLAYEVVLFLLVQFQHANIRLPFALERGLSVLVVTPLVHRVHHSREMEESNSNYSSILTLWDRLFGTWRWRADSARISIGLSGYEGPEAQTLPGLLETPAHSEAEGMVSRFGEQG